jgi:hypothetical protein
MTAYVGDDKSEYNSSVSAMALCPILFGIVFIAGQEARIFFVHLHCARAHATITLIHMGVLNLKDSEASSGFC